jgi:Cysteine rich repeat
LSINRFQTACKKAREKKMVYRSMMIALLSLALFAFPVTAKAAGGLMTYCKADVERLCAGVEPGGGRIVKCLKEHKMEMSIGCGKALQKLKAGMGQ